MTTQWHPASKIFPMLSMGRLAELVEDIRQNGLLEPIVTHQGMVLDGRNRYLACEMAKVEPRYVEWDGECKVPELYVYSRNGTRRDLTMGQKAVAAAKLVPILAQMAKGRQVAAGVRGEEGGRGKKKTLPVKRREGFTLTGSSKLSKDQPPKNGAEARQHEHETCDIAGKMMGVSGTLVRRAIMVQDNDPVAFEALGMGEGTVNAEYARVRELPKRTHRAASTEDNVDKVKGRRKQVVTGNRLIVWQNAAKRRLTQILSHIDGSTSGIGGAINMDYVRAACSEREIRELTKMALGSAQRLRWVGNQLVKRSK
jgi:hypothetical protein